MEVYMTTINPNTQGVGNQQSSPTHKQDSPSGKVSTSDSNEFSDLMNHNSDAASKTNKPEDKKNSEQELRDLISKSGFQQFMERSKELTEEMKKNFEG